MRDQTRVKRAQQSPLLHILKAVWRLATVWMGGPHGGKLKSRSHNGDVEPSLDLIAEWSVVFYPISARVRNWAIHDMVLSVNSPTAMLTHLWPFHHLHANSLCFFREKLQSIFVIQSLYLVCIQAIYVIRLLHDATCIYLVLLFQVSSCLLFLISIYSTSNWPSFDVRMTTVCLLTFIRMLEK